MFIEELLNLPNGTSLLLNQVEEKSGQEGGLILESENDGRVGFERRAREAGVQFRDAFGMRVVLDAAKSIELTIGDRSGGVRSGVGNEKLETNLGLEVIEGLQSLGIVALE